MRNVPIKNGKVGCPRTGTVMLLDGLCGGCAFHRGASQGRDRGVLCDYKQEQDLILVDSGLFEMLLNSIANLLHIGEMSDDVQSDWVRVINGVWNDGMRVLSNHQSLPKPEPFSGQKRDPGLRPILIQAIREAVDSFPDGTYGVNIKVASLLRVAAEMGGERVSTSEAFGSESTNPDRLIYALRNLDLGFLTKMQSFDRLREELSKLELGSTIDEVLASIADLIEEGIAEDSYTLRACFSSKQQLEDVLRNMSPEMRRAASIIVSNPTKIEEIEI